MERTPSSKTINVIVKRVGWPAVVEQHENDLDGAQAIVGGPIEAVWVEDSLYMICNEDGKLIGLRPNFPMPQIEGVIVGDVFFVRLGDDGEHVSVHDDDLGTVKRLVGEVDEQCFGDDCNHGDDERTPETRDPWEK